MTSATLPNFAAFDAGIRRVLPGYDEMSNEVQGALAEHFAIAPTSGGPTRILDLGCGSGRFTAAAWPRFPAAHFTLVDVEPAVLDLARERMARLAGTSDVPRATFLRGSFLEPLPASDAVVASLALHHARTPDAKVDAYRHARGALSAGGLFVTCDVMLPAAQPLRTRASRRWVEHMMAGGDTEAEALARIARWEEDERYFSIDEELAFARAGGFECVDVRWRKGPLAVLVAVRE